MKPLKKALLVSFSAAAIVAASIGTHHIFKDRQAKSIGIDYSTLVSYEKNTPEKDRWNNTTYSQKSIIKTYINHEVTTELLRSMLDYGLSHEEICKEFIHAPNVFERFSQFMEKDKMEELFESYKYSQDYYDVTKLEMMRYVLNFLEDDFSSDYIKACLENHISQRTAANARQAGLTKIRDVKLAKEFNINLDEEDLFKEKSLDDYINEQASNLGVKREDWKIYQQMGLNDEERALFVERGITGEVVSCIHDYIKYEPENAKRMVDYVMQGELTGETYKLWESAATSRRRVIADIDFLLRE